MKKRIWELDAFRGICILGMVAVHFVYDMTELYQLADWKLPQWFYILQTWGSLFFLLLSGICVTLGSHSVRRGLIVFGCGMLCTAVTVGMSFVGFDDSIIIYFGVLHCLGVCMLLWPLLKRLPTWALAVLGTAIAAAGLYITAEPLVDFPWLIPFGFTYPGFATSDYFPLLPYLGFFLLGSVLGRTVYRKKETLFPKVNPDFFLLRFFIFCGKQSLFIYLLHQPILSGLFMLLTL